MTVATTDITDPAREVLNQAPPLQAINLFEVDLALREALEREGGDSGIERARETGAVAGSVETLEHSRRAERNLPVLRT
ncbi:MAG TPA: DNA alkylation response protein, partial [Solirubrobacteraceae bacterium]